MTLTLIYPEEADNDFKKYYCCYRIAELLKAEPNEEREGCLVSEILRLKALAMEYNWEIDLGAFFQDKIDYPAAADDNFKKYYCIYRAQELIWLQHNASGESCGNEATKLWKNYLKNWYNPRKILVVAEILRLRQLARDYVWEGGMILDNIFVEV